MIIACEAEFDVVFDPETDFTDEALGTARALFDADPGEARVLTTARPTARCAR